MPPSDLLRIADPGPARLDQLLTDEHHPFQALADLLTLRERFGRLAGLRLAYVGDGDNVAHSLMEAGALAGMHVAIATPPGHEPAPAVAAWATSAAGATGGSVTVTTDPHEAVDMHRLPEQAHNRLPATQAVLQALISGDWSG